MALTKASRRTRAKGRAMSVLRGMPRPHAPRLGPRVTGTVESVREWAAETPGATYEQIMPAEDYVRRPARTMMPAPLPRMEALRSHRSPAAFRALVPGARLVDLHGALVLTSDARVLVESAVQLDRSVARSGPRLHRPERRSGRYMALLNQWSENHFHWLADTLPRASLLPLDEDRDTPVIIPAALTGAQRESLALIGLEPERLVPFDHPHIQVDELVLPSFAGQPTLPPPWAALWLRDRLAPPEAPADRRFWVSRAALTRGRVVNEDAVMDLLAGYGFEPLQPENLSFAEQLHMFGTAEVIMGAHGSAFTNIVAARHATVIELQSERWWGRGVHYAMSDALGLDYWYLFCDSTRLRDLVVDLALLEATVEAALAARTGEPASGARERDGLT